MKIDMEIEIEALTGLHQIKGNLEAKVKSLEAELSSTRLKVNGILYNIKMNVFFFFINYVYFMFKNSAQL